MLDDCFKMCGQGIALLKQLNHCRLITYKAFLHMKVSLACQYDDLDWTVGEPH